VMGSAAANENSRPSGRTWSWLALGWALAFAVLSIPTFGLAVLLAPVGLALSAAAWRRAPHDGVFWVGATLNSLGVFGLLGILVGLLTGDVGIGWD
jgi:hypothetical protein